MRKPVHKKRRNFSEKESLRQQESDLFFLRVLQTGITALRDLRLEFFDTSRGVDVLQTTRVERMACTANVDFQFRFGAARHERVAAAAGNFRFDVIRMNFFFHFFGSLKKKMSMNNFR